MPTLSLDDATLFYEVHGTGDPLLLISGFSGDNASWAPLLPHLGGGFQVLRPDNRGSGRTVPWDAPNGLGRYAEDCVSLLDHLGIKKAHVVGHSMGGLIGMELATRFPERLATLTLAAIGPLRVKRNVALFEALIAIRRSDAPPDTWLRTFFPWLFRAEAFDDPDYIETAVAMSLAYPHAQSVDAMEHQLRALDDYDPDRVHVTCPTQAILGSADLLIEAHRARKALARIPDVEIHVIDGAAHSIHWDDPAGVAERLHRFIDRHPL